ncbi:MAG: insulinase family protein [Anaeromyxobacter sp.]
MPTRLVALALAALLPSSALAVTYKPQGKPVPYQGFHAQFPSGMQLVVYEMPSVDRFTVTLSYGSGQMHDPAGKEGLAHLAEHLAFRSIPSWTGSVSAWDWLTRGGYQFNAFTDQDRTDYWIKGKPAELRLALLLEAARMRDPLAGVTEDDVSIERDVLVSEYRQRFETVDHGPEVDWVLEQAFPGHPFGKAHEAPETVRGLTLADAAAFTKQHYRPENAILVVISPRKAKEVAALVTDVFGELAVPKEGAPRQPLTPAFAPLPAAKERKPVTRTAPVTSPVVWVAWPTPGATAKRDPQGHAVADAVGGRFIHDLYEAYNYTASNMIAGYENGFYSWNGAGMVWVRVQLGPGGNVDKVVEAIKTAAFEVRTANTSEAARYTRDDLLMKSYLSLESIDGSAVAKFLRATGMPDYLQAWQRMVALQLKTDASNYAAEYLTRERAAVVVIKPDQNALARSLVAGGGPREDLGEAGEVTGVASLVPPVAPGLGKAERRTLANGLEVVVIQRGSLPVAELRLLVRTGVTGTPQAPAGIAEVALGSNVAKFAARGQWLTASQETTTRGPEEVIRIVRGSSANLDALLTGIGSWAGDQQARYFDQMKETQRGIVSTLEREPTWRAGTLLRAALYPGHAYGQQLSLASISKISAGDADRWLSTEIRPDRATLLLVSDQAPTPELWKAIEEAMGGWHKGGTPRPATPAPALPAGRMVVLLDRPGASQALFYLGVRAPPPRERDEAAGAALRWTLDTRLNTRLRVEEGVSYGFHSAWEDLPSAGALVIALAVDRDAAATSLTTILDATRDLAAKPLELPQLAAARHVVAREYAFRYDTVGGVSEALTDAARYGRAPGYEDDLAASIAGLTAERVQATAGTLALGKEAIVVMGDAATVRPQLEKAGFTVEVVK